MPPHKVHKPAHRAHEPARNAFEPPHNAYEHAHSPHDSQHPPPASQQRASVSISEACSQYNTAWNSKDTAVAVKQEFARTRRRSLARGFAANLRANDFAVDSHASTVQAGQIMANHEIPLYRQKPTPPLGEWLRQLRQEKKLALREVAAAADMDPAHLSKAELGQRLPTCDQVVKLAKFFDADATLMEAKRVAEKVMQEITASSAGAEALNLLREDPGPPPIRKPLKP